jgi:hypothetical protein
MLARFTRAVLHNSTVQWTECIKLAVLPIATISIIIINRMSAKYYRYQIHGI